MAVPTGPRGTAGAPRNAPRTTGRHIATQYGDLVHPRPAYRCRGPAGNRAARRWPGPSGWDATGDCAPQRVCALVRATGRRIRPRPQGRLRAGLTADSRQRSGGHTPPACRTASPIGSGLILRLLPPDRSWRSGPLAVVEVEREAGPTVLAPSDGNIGATAHPAAPVPGEAMCRASARRIPTCEGRRPRQSRAACSWRTRSRRHRRPRGAPGKWSTISRRPARVASLPRILPRCDNHSVEPTPTRRSVRRHPGRGPLG